jgi:hypothetical protein
MGVAHTTEKVQRMMNERGWGLKNLLGETLVLVFLAVGSMMNATLRISLKYLPINTTCSTNCGNIDNAIFLCSNGYVSSSSSYSICTRDYFFSAYEIELGPTPSSFPFFFSSSIDLHAGCV